MPTLRSYCAAIALLIGTGSAASALENRVAVATSYPDELMARFEAAFEKANPGVFARRRAGGGGRLLDAVAGDV